ncbi:MAG: cytochrome c oxidase assembly protein [Alphaproteobacteria bacterium]|nr:cytochrome c oxidase assembly protein [Alphaproteobacteria bacterium]
MATVDARHRKIALPLLAIAAGMAMLSYASVPLYRLFCQVTGYGGTTRVAVAPPAAGVVDRDITIRFDANISRELAWSFVPAQPSLTLKVGEEGLAFYRATNLGTGPLVGTATFNVTPDKAGRYFNKIQCFCFTEQRLEPGETVDMPVLFFVDPEIVKDRHAGDVKIITLSYTFFPATGDGKGTAGRTVTGALAVPSR